MTMRGTMTALSCLFFMLIEMAFPGVASCCTGTPQAAVAAGLNLRRIGKTLEVTARIPKDVDQIELRIESDRNLNITRMTDVSPFDPQPEKRRTTNLSSDTDIFYPIVDVVVEPGMEAVAVFDGNRMGKCVVGGPFHREVVPLEREMIVPANKLEYWENSIFVEPSSDVTLRGFYLRQRFPVIIGKLGHTFQLLSEDWSGRVSIYAVRPDAFEKLATATLEPVKNSVQAPPRKKYSGQGLSKDRLMEAVKGTTDFTLRCQNRNPQSPTYGGPFLFYDLDARTYRTSYWMWGWGPSAKLLLEAAKMKKVAREFGRGRLREVADDIGRASLRFQLHDESSPADGLGVASWTRGLGGGQEYDHGYRICLTATDALFLAGWAWAPLYEETGQDLYLAALHKLTLATERLMDQGDLLPWIYYYNLDEWSDYVLNESGYGVKGLAAAYRLTENELYRKAGLRLIEQHLPKFQRSDGLWERMWLFKEKRARPSIFHTRAQGWVMEGLLSAHTLTPDGQYLGLAEHMAETLMKWQHPSGYWTHDFKSPVEEVGISEKGTALWSLLFYRLYRFTDDERHLQTARRALQWCLENEYRGSDPAAHGSIVGRTRSSAVGYRWWFNVSCVYTSAFYGLAAMEELRIQGRR